MTRKSFVVSILIIFLVVAIGIVGGYFYMTNTKTFDKNKNEGSGSLAPFGENGSNSLNNGFGSTTPGQIPKFRQLSNKPVAGYDFVDTPTGYSIWFVNREDGNVLEASTSTLNIKRITNTTIRKVYEAYIGKNGSNIVLRTLEDGSETIQTFIGSPKAKTGTSTDDVKDLVGVFGPQNISTLSMSPSKESFFGITSSMSGGVGSIYPLGGKPSAIFYHSIFKWIPQWINGTTIVMTSAPSARTQNATYLFNTQTKTMSQIISPRNGLVISVSSDASNAVISENKNNLLISSLLNLKDNGELQISKQTIADKCVWAKTKLVAYCGFPKDIPNGVYPDYWYQGKVSFEDTVGAVNTTSGNINQVFDPNSFATKVDIMNPIISKDDKYLIFTNKQDLTLWMLEL